MTEKAAVSRASDLRRMLPGVLVSLAALAALLYFVDLGEMVAALRLADYRYLPLAALLFLGTLAARAAAWRTILKEQVPYGKVFLTINEGYMLNNLLPLRLGELGRAFLLGRTTALSFWEVLSTILIERVIDVAFMAGLLLGTLPFVIGADWARSAALAAAGLVLVGFAVLYLLARNQAWALAAFERLAARWPRLVALGRGRLESFLSGLGALTEARRFGRILLWMLLTWGFNIAWNFALLRAFVPGAGVLAAAFAVGVSSLGVSVPSSPAYIAVLEAALVGALTLFDIDPSVALAFALVNHSLYFAITVGIGAYGLGRDGQSLGDLYREIRRTPASVEDPADFSD